MPLLTNPTRPKPPRLNKRRQIAQKDSQTTLREEPDEFHDDADGMEYDYAPPLPPKLDMSYERNVKALPITPMDSPQEAYHVGGVPFQIQQQQQQKRAPTPPPKQSTSNRWKSAMGKILTLRRSNQTSKARKHLTPPPLSPASSRRPSFYVPDRDFRMHRSAVTLLTSGSSTQHSQEDYDDQDVVTNIGLSRSSLVQGSPVTPITSTRGGYHDHMEPISAVLQRAVHNDVITVPSPITPYTPYSPVRRSPTAPAIRRDPSSRPARPSTPHYPRHHVYQHQRRPSFGPVPTPSPPPIWPAPGSPPLIVANPTPAPTPSPPPVLVKRSKTQTTRSSEPPRPKLRTNASEGVLPVLTLDTSSTSQKRAGPRILQARLPSPITPDPKKHVFTGPWMNRRGDEWLGISAVPGEYRVKAAKEEKAFDPKYLSYPEELHHFMNPMGDVMDAKTLGMVSKAVRL